MKAKEYLHKMTPADKLIVFITVLFVITKTLVYAGGVEEQQLNEWLCVPPNIHWLQQRPWVLLSYAFYHVGFEHFFGNVLFLFLIGRVFFRSHNLEQFIVVYFLGVLTGAFTFLLVGYYFPQWTGNTMLLGASAAIMALLAFIVTLTPNYGVYIFTYRIKILYVLLIIIFLDLINISTNSGGKIAHWGGTLMGVIIGLSYKYYFIHQRKTNLDSKTQQSHFEEQQKIKKHKIKQLLDKISSSGYESLTDKEKKYLFEASKND